MANFPFSVDAAFGSRLRFLREEREWTQAQLVDKMRAGGIDYMNTSTLSRIEMGGRPVRLSEARAVARIFQVTIEAMTSESESLAIVQVRHRAAREEFVRFRQAVENVARWQVKMPELLDTLDEIIDEADSDETVLKELEMLTLNVNNFEAINLAEEAQAIVDQVRAGFELNETTKAGRFLNSSATRRSHG